MKKLHLPALTAALTGLAATLFFGSTFALAFDEVSLKKLKALNVCIGCDLRGANLEKAKLDGASLIGANLEKANLSGAYLKEAKLNGANLEYANLSGAYLLKADLEKANSEKANLSDTVLVLADLRGANLEYANLKNANLNWAILCKTKMPWGEENSGCSKTK